MSIESFFCCNFAGIYRLLYLVGLYFSVFNMKSYGNDSIV